MRQQVRPVLRNYCDGVSSNGLSSSFASAEGKVSHASKIFLMFVATSEWKKRIPFAFSLLAMLPSAIRICNMQKGGDQNMVRVAMHHKTGTVFFQKIMTEWANHHSLSLAHGSRCSWSCRFTGADVCLQRKFHEQPSKHTMPKSMFVPRSVHSLHVYTPLLQMVLNRSTSSPIHRCFTFMLSETPLK